MMAARRRTKLTAGRPLELAAAQVRALAPGRLRRGIRRPGRRIAPRAGAGGAARGRDRRVAAGKGRPVPPHIRRQLRRRRRGFTPRGRRVAAVLVLLIAVLGGGWLWLRDSSLVSVEQVSVTGADGADAGQISSGLTAAARRMTTLDVNPGRLRAAVARYPVVAGLRVNAHFPHRMTIRVVERIPVAKATVNGRQIAVSADGMLLSDVPTAAAVPGLSTAAASRGGRLSGARAREELALLAAAPNALIAKVSQVSVDSTHGLSAQLRDGPVLYFGDAGELAPKWVAAVAVLADPGSAGAAYIDVTDPHRPAAGMGSGQASGSSAGQTPGTGIAQTSSASTAQTASASTAQTPSASVAQASPGGTVQTTPAAANAQSPAGTAPSSTSG